MQMLEEKYGVEPSYAGPLHYFVKIENTALQRLLDDCNSYSRRRAEIQNPQDVAAALSWYFVCEFRLMELYDDHMVFAVFEEYEDDETYKEMIRVCKNGVYKIRT